MINIFDFTLRQLIKAMKRKVVAFDLKAAAEFKAASEFKRLSIVSKLAAAKSLEQAVALEARAERLEQI